MTQTSVQSFEHCKHFFSRDLLSVIAGASGMAIAWVLVKDPGLRMHPIIQDLIYIVLFVGFGVSLFMMARWMEQRHAIVKRLRRLKKRRIARIGL